MNRLKVNRVLLYICLIFNIILVYKYISLINESDISKEILNKNNQFQKKIESIQSDIKIRDSLTYITVGEKLEPSEISIQKNKGDISIIFRFSEMNCGVCLDEEMVTLKEKIKDLPISFSYTFADNDKVVKQTIANYGLDNGLLKKAKTELPIDDLNVPYYLIVNSQLEIIDIFIPIKGNRALSLQFLNICNIKYGLQEKKINYGTRKI